MIEAHTPLLLGSGSPRRLEILRRLRIPTVVHAAETNEQTLPSESPTDYLQRVTIDKLKSVAHFAKGNPVGAVLVADTVVIVDGTILGKPNDEQHAVDMLRSLSGREHQVSTRFVIANASRPSDPVDAQTITSSVFFRSLTQEEIEGYARTGEGLDKAGAYAVQGIGSFAVERINGSYDNVVGLPTCEVIRSLLATRLIARFPL